MSSSLSFPILAESDTPHPSRTDSSTEIRLSAPRELFRLTEAISAAAQHAPVGPLESMYQAGRAMLHQKYPLPMGLYATSIFAPETSSLHRLEVLSETLLTFLNALQDGIVTSKR
jgi:phosphatidylinositol-bisphosphatase